MLKLALPDKVHDRDDLEREVAVLRLVDGRGCVRVLEHDPERGAVLLERLGRQLHQLALPVRTQLEHICETLDEMWGLDPSGLALPTTLDKANTAQRQIEAGRDTLGRLADVALTFAERRAAAHDAADAVLLHGDAHAWNTLEDPSGGFRFVDPDGLVGEREYDLAISMREFTDELLEGDTSAIGRARAQFLGDLTGTDPEAIWEWGIVERVTNGLLWLRDGEPGLAEPCFTIAERWTSG